MVLLIRLNSPFPSRPRFSKAKLQAQLSKPLNAQTFVHSLKERLITALAQFNRVLPQLRHLRIFHPKKHEERGLWVLAKLEPQPEPRSLGLIKEAIDKRYGILDLLDVFFDSHR